MLTIRASDDSNINAIIETKSGTGMFGGGWMQTSTVTLPVTIAVSRSSGARVRILAKDNPGYKNTEFTIPKAETINPWYFGNLIFGGAIGTTTTDPLSGSMWKYANDVFIVPVAKDKK